MSGNLLDGTVGGSVGNLAGGAGRLDVAADTDTDAGRWMASLLDGVGGLIESTDSARVLAQAGAALVDSLHGVAHLHGDMRHMFEAVHQAAACAYEDLAVSLETLDTAAATCDAMAAQAEQALERSGDALRKALAVSDAGVAWVAQMAGTELEHDVLLALFSVVGDELAASGGALVRLGEELR